MDTFLDAPALSDTGFTASLRRQERWMRDGQPAKQPLGPAPSIRRLPRYLEFLQQEQRNGRTTVSTTHIADALGGTAIQVRKDLALTGIVGRPRVGYDLDELVSAVERFLGWDSTTDAFLVGVGHLGSALLGYGGFAGHGLRIVGAFDSDRRKIGSRQHGHEVLAMHRLPGLARRMRVRIGILTVPRERAQAVADMLVTEAGLVAIWNFADPDLR
ncbi:MAG: redox-sensing transcriptional repressor Rex, partial [Planctomycetota bacterium]